MLPFFKALLEKAEKEKNQPPLEERDYDTSILYAQDPKTGKTLVELMTEALKKSFEDMEELFKQINDGYGTKNFIHSAFDKIKFRKQSKQIKSFTQIAEIHHSHKDLAATILCLVINGDLKNKKAHKPTICMDIIIKHLETSPLKEMLENIQTHLGGALPSAHKPAYLPFYTVDDIYDKSTPAQKKIVDEIREIATLISRDKDLQYAIHSASSEVTSLKYESGLEMIPE